MVRNLALNISDKVIQEFISKKLLAVKGIQQNMNKNKKVKKRDSKTNT